MTFQPAKCPAAYVHLPLEPSTAAECDVSGCVTGGFDIRWSANYQVACAAASRQLSVVCHEVCDFEPNERNEQQPGGDALVRWNRSWGADSVR